MNNLKMPGAMHCSLILLLPIGSIFNFKAHGGKMYKRCQKEMIRHENGDHSWLVEGVMHTEGSLASEWNGIFILKFYHTLNYFLLYCTQHNCNVKEVTISCLFDFIGTWSILTTSQIPNRPHLSPAQARTRLSVGCTATLKIRWGTTLATRCSVSFMFLVLATKLKLCKTSL